MKKEDIEALFKLEPTEKSTLEAEKYDKFILQQKKIKKDNTKKYFIRNNLTFQSFREQWEKIITEFSSRITQPTKIDIEFLNNYLENYFNKHLPIPVDIYIDNIYKKATILEFGFDLNINARGDILFSIEPTMHCFNIDMIPYAYQGVIE